MRGELSVSKTCPEHDTGEGKTDTCKVFDSNSLPPTIQCIFQQHDGLPKSWVNVVKVRRNTGIYTMKGENKVFYMQRPAGWVSAPTYRWPSMSKLEYVAPKDPNHISKFVPFTCSLMLDLVLML
ncbi:hypothetical protein U1Q18_014629 [Sarracenia purpurea var. burkii]